MYNNRWLSLENHSSKIPVQELEADVIVFLLCFIDVNSQIYDVEILHDNCKCKLLIVFCFSDVMKLSIFACIV